MQILFHAGFMSAGAFMMICAAVIVLAMKKKRWWLKAHRSCGIAGAMLMAAGFIAISLAPETTASSLFLEIHSVIGISVIVLSICAPILALLMFKMKKKWMRPAHRWAGRFAVICAPVNIAFGLFLIGII